MSLHRSFALGALVLVGLLQGCSDGGKDAVAPTASGANPSGLKPSFTVGSGSTSTPLGRATFSQGLHRVMSVKRTTGDWSIELIAKPSFDIAVQSIDFAPGSQSGWHRHPGPVFIQVVTGTMTFYDSDDPSCSPVVRSAGQGFLDLGEHAHIARNETRAPAQNLVTYFAPPGAALRIDSPKPGNCPF
jgi:hypothetical protein